MSWFIECGKFPQAFVEAGKQLQAGVCLPVCIPVTVRALALC